MKASVDSFVRRMVLCGWLLSTGLSAVAASRASANYSILTEELGAGGGTGESASYGLTASVETSPTGQSESPAYQSQNGYVQQAAAFARLVEGRWVFYNRSAWDGNDPTANAEDDDAIALDKAALLPGTTAAFANYTSYSRGLNGVMIDVTVNGALGANDFAFKVGNSDTLVNWSTAPTPSSISVRYGAGSGGSDRVTLIWADNAIQKQWLQVTVKATVNTGLAADDVFYFGNAIGETGNSHTDAQVNSTDVNGARANPQFSINPASITNVYDFNRDKLVNSTDVNVARIHTTFSVNALKLITPSGSVTTIRSGSSLENLHTATGEATVLTLLPGHPESGTVPVQGGSSQSADPTSVQAASVHSTSAPSSGPELRVVASSDSQLWLEVRGAEGMPCQLEACTDFGASQWEIVGQTETADTNTSLWRIPINSELKHCFFRLVAWPNNGISTP